MRIRLKGWRTIIFNALAAVPVIVLEVLPAVMPVLSMAEVQAVIPAAWLSWYLLAVALGNMALRAVTTTPLGKDRS